MATLAVTHTFVDATAAEAAEVNQNFDDVTDFVNTEVIHRDASIAFTSVPSGPASDPSTANQLVRKSYVDDQIDVVEAAAAAAAARVAVRLNRTTNQTTGASGTEATFSWNDEIQDTHGFWSSGTTITIPSGQSGIYAITLKSVTTDTPKMELWIDTTIGKFYGGFTDGDSDAGLQRGMGITVPLNATATITAGVRTISDTSFAFTGSIFVYKVSI